MRSVLPSGGKSYPKPPDYSPSGMVKVALAYAERSIPVFTLRPKTKEPFHGSRSFYDATDDLEKVRELWRKSPNANVAYPTGKASGLLVLDEDRAGAIAELEAKHGKLPATTTVRTPRDGRHLYFKYPDSEKIGNSAGKLGAGLDVRGEGGYVVAPGSSTTQGRYEWVDKHPVAEAPEWLLEKLREPHSAATGNVRTASPSPTPAEGETIPEGSRNWSLYRIACRLRAQGYDREAIQEHLGLVNTSRCSPALEADELEKIAKSASRHAPGNASPEVSPEVLEMIDRIRDSWWDHEWKGIGGYSARDVEHALLLLAAMHGQMIPAGVRVSVDYRTVALMAGVSVSTVNRAVKRLKVDGWLRCDNAEQQRGKAGAFVLVSLPRIVEHSTTRVPYGEKPLEVVPSCAPPTAPRLRWSRPMFSRVANELIRETLRRAGKIAGAIVDHLERTGDWITWKELAAMMGHKRPRDLRARQGNYLAAPGVVECSGDYVRLTADWLEALNRMREQDGEIADHRRDMAEYERQRDAYRNRHRHEAEQAPTPAEMRERRENAHERRRDAIAAGIGRLFRERPEYRRRRVGQITCAIINMGLPDDFPHGVGAGGAPKDHEIAAILRENGVLEDNGVDVAA